MNLGCVARILSSFKMANNYWVQRVNPNWYEAREIPKTLLKVNKKEPVALTETISSRWSSQNKKF